MAIKAINTINATIQVRIGLEQDLDTDQLTAGEWAVSKDTKYVRMCFAPGIVLRMATYEAFEQDMIEIQTILATCRDIQAAVDAMARLAEQHANAIKTSADAAKKSETNAKASEIAAKSSQTAAATSATNAKSSEVDALASKNAAAVSADTAKDKASEADTSATNAATSASTASQKANAASVSAANAANSATTAAQKAAAASLSAEDAEDYSAMSRSWAVGEGNMRPNESIDNAKYYAEQAKKIVVSGGSGGLIPMGTVTFEGLPTSDIDYGDMYNISNAFTSDTRFEDGGGIRYGAGANVYYTAGGKWDVLTGVQVTGVKGAAETAYREGNVNLTPQNIGALSSSGGTVSGSIYVSRATTGGSYFNAVREDTDITIRFGIHSGGLKRGVYDVSLQKWVVDIEGESAIFNGDLNGNAKYAFSLVGADDVIPAGSDLDDYNTPGNFRVQNAADAKTIAHSPITYRGYMLYVVRPYGIASSNYVVQFVVDLEGSIRIRYYISDGAGKRWSNWDRIALASEMKDSYTLPVADAEVRGGVKIGYAANGKNYPVLLHNEQMYVNVPWTDTNTTYSNFVKSGSGAKSGLVPSPGTTAGTTKYLREDGTWAVPPDTNTTYGNMTAATSSAAGKAGLAPAPAAGKQNAFLRGDGTWVTPSTSLSGNVAGIPADQTAVKMVNDKGAQMSVYKGTDGNLHFRNWAGADTVIPFNTYKDVAYIFRDGVFDDNVASHTLYNAVIEDKNIVEASAGSYGVYGTLKNPSAYKYITIKIKAPTDSFPPAQFGIGSSGSKLPGLSSGGTGRVQYVNISAHSEGFCISSNVLKENTPVYYVSGRFIVSEIFVHNGAL